MGFYEEFSKYYDSIFPLKSVKANFLSKHFSDFKGKLTGSHLSVEFKCINMLELYNTRC